MDCACNQYLCERIVCFVENYICHEIESIEELVEAVNSLDDNLFPSLRQLGFDLAEYASKLFVFGKAWSHYNSKEPISIIAGYTNDTQSKIAYISLIVVDKRHRHKHLASSLLSVFEEYAIYNGMEAVKLEVRKDNEAAQALYRKFDYEIIGDATDYSYYMVKQLEI